MKPLLTTTLLILSSLSAFASKLDGVWTGNFDTSFGPLQLTATYQVAGETLSGRITLNVGGNQAGGQIENGVISGDTFKYSYNVQGRSITHDGKLVNDQEILIQSDSGYEFTLTPVPSKISGTWKGTADSSYGLVELTPKYEVSGSKISGTIALSVGGNYLEETIHNGVVSGDTFKYSYSIQGTSITHEGKLVSDHEISIDSSTGIEIKLTRAEE